MRVDINKVMDTYAEAYKNLYQRSPKSLEALNEDWVLVNDAKMRVSELEYLTNQLQLEYNQMRRDRRSLVRRLIAWLKS